MNTYFVTGISTDVGKTIASAILVEALKADYWKPIQAGDLDNSDTHKVKRLVSNTKTKFHNEGFQLHSAMSPHAAADIDNVKISAKNLNHPKTKNNLVIEGAGGILVPINDSETIIDLIKPKNKVIVVSRHYLGSINHTLMTINMIKEKGLEMALIFSGDENQTSEDIIKKMTQVPVVGRIFEEPYFDKNVILDYADQFLQEPEFRNFFYGNEEMNADPAANGTDDAEF